MKAEVIMRLVAGALQDMEPDVEKRWSWEHEHERVGLLDFINDALRAIVLQRPEAMAVTEVIRLEPGMRQALPDPARHGCKHRATMLIELTRNMGSNGECPGRSILPVEMEILRAWACFMAEGACVENYACDRMTNPKHYMVYPAVPRRGDVYVEATFGVEPCVVKGPECCICLPDSYAPAVMHHVMAAILSGDSEVSQLEKAAWHMQMYRQVMGIKLAVDHGWPRAKSSPVPGGAA